MKDLTLKFHDKLQFKAFLSSLDWEEDEDLQNKLCLLYTSDAADE